MPTKEFVKCLVINRYTKSYNTPWMTIAYPVEDVEFVEREHYTELWLRSSTGSMGQEPWMIGNVYFLREDIAVLWNASIEHARMNRDVPYVGTEVKRQIIFVEEGVDFKDGTT